MEWEELPLEFMMLERDGVRQILSLLQNARMLRIVVRGMVSSIVVGGGGEQGGRVNEVAVGVHYAGKRENKVIIFSVGKCKNNVT